MHQKKKEEEEIVKTITTRIPACTHLHPMHSHTHTHTLMLLHTHHPCTPIHTHLLDEYIATYASRPPSAYESKGPGNTSTHRPNNPGEDLKRDLVVEKPIFIKLKSFLSLKCPKSISMLDVTVEARVWTLSAVTGVAVVIGSAVDGGSTIVTLPVECGLTKQIKAPNTY